MKATNLLKTLLLTAISLGTLTLADDDDGDTNTVNECIRPQACFQNTIEPNVDYCIASSWKITYPKDLRRNLAKTPGITMIDYQNIDFDTCGWNTGIESVEAKSVDRGTIYYKAHNSSLSFRPSTFNRQAAPAIATMKATYPLTEIMLILLFCVIIPIGLPILIIIGMCVCSIWGDLRKARHAHAVRRAVASERKREEKERKKEEQMREKTWGMGSGNGSSDGSSDGSSTVVGSEGKNWGKESV